MGKQGEEPGISAGLATHVCCLLVLGEATLLAAYRSQCGKPYNLHVLNNNQASNEIRLFPLHAQGPYLSA